MGLFEKVFNLKRVRQPPIKEAAIISHPVQVTGQYLSKDYFDPNLRLGDIIDGFSYIIPIFEDFVNKTSTFNLKVKPIKHFVVLTPCCSIENKLITLVPLKEIETKLIQVPYYAEDFTRINKPHAPYLGIPPDKWEHLNEDQRNEILNKEIQYQYTEKYVYSECEFFSEYQLKYKKLAAVATKAYWIDFKDAFTINSDKIDRNVTYAKVLQLTIKGRHELRQKIADFYARIPDEDKEVD